MKYVKLLPLLIAAVFAMPRAHAAGADAAGAPPTPSGHISESGALIAAIGLLALARRRPRNEIFKYQSEL